MLTLWGMRLLQRIRKSGSMLTIIENVLNDAQLSRLSGLIAGLAWEDGAKTAGATARRVKHNLQANLSSEIGQKVGDTLSRAVLRHPVLKAAAQPQRLSRILVSKTGPGGGYGRHIDNAFMPTDSGAIRTDLSFTLFLNDPADYEGGALEIEQAGNTHEIKLKAGQMVVYPTSCLHQVRTVSSGERLVCVGWIESRVRRSEDRETLFDLANLQAALSETHDPQSPEMLTLSKIIANLKRRFN